MKYYLIFSIFSIFILTNCGKSKTNKKSKKNMKKNKKLKDGKIKKPVNKIVEFQKYPVEIPTDTSYTLSFRPWNNKKIVKSLTNDENTIFPPVFAKTHVFNKLWSGILNPETIGIDSKHSVVASYFYGDEKGWKKSFDAIKLWAEGFKTKKVDLTKPEDSKAFIAKMSDLEKKFTWLKHRIIIPLKNPGKFALYVKKQFVSEVSKECPLDKDKTKRPVNGLWMKKSVSKKCAKNKIPSFSQGVPFLFTLNKKSGYFISLRVFTDHARIDYLEITEELTFFEYKYSRILKSLEAKHKHVNSLREFDLQFFTNKKVALNAMTYLGAITIFPALRFTPAKNMISILQNGMISANSPNIIGNFDSVLAESSTISLKTSKNSLEFKWKINKLGKYLLKSILKPEYQKVDDKLITSIVESVRAIYLKKKSKRLKNGKKLRQMCGIFCKIDCIDRLSLNCLFPNSLNSVEKLKTNFYSFLKNIRLPLNKFSSIKIKKTEDEVILKLTLK
jgi:hypothetical protein